jgi:membrane dipeptidase
MQFIRRPGSRVSLCKTSGEVIARWLVKACNDAKILIDLSQITEKGFFDVAKLSIAPLVATHSNAHALCPSARNLTDRQLDAIRETGGW